MPTLDTVEVGPQQADFAVIWLHGLGADGHDFEAIVPELRLPKQPSVHFVFPHAPIRPVTLNGGMAMRAWYDIYDLDRKARQDLDGIRQSQAQVEELIAAENERGIPNERIVLAGFSQGGAIALHTGLRVKRPLRGIMALSTYLPVHDRLLVEREDANQQTPIFFAHGQFDPVLPMTMGKASADLLTQHGHQVEWHDYPMPHSVSPHEIIDIREWLQGLFRAK